MRIAELIEHFDKFNARHKAPKTCRFYKQRLAQFRARFGKRKAESITLLEIDEYLCGLINRKTGQPLSDSTKRHNIVSLNALQSFAKRHKLIEKLWYEAGDLEKPRMGRRQRIPTAEEMGKLLAEAGPSFRLIYMAIAQSGGRPGEIVRAKISDIKPDPLRLEIAEHKTAKKTGQPRIIPIGQQLAQTIAIGQGRRTRGPIFLRKSRKPWTLNALDAQLRRARDAAGLDPEIVLYSNRHFFATTLLSAGVAIEDVSALLGHKSIATTQLYLHRPVTDLTARQDKIPHIDIPPRKA